jgi:hypothetical protein
MINGIRIRVVDVRRNLADSTSPNKDKADAATRGGVKIMEWSDTERRLPNQGRIGLQVHGGGDLTRQCVRYRNIRVKPLDAAATAP